MLRTRSLLTASFVVEGEDDAPTSMTLDHRRSQCWWNALGPLMAFLRRAFDMTPVTSEDRLGPSV